MLDDDYSQASTVSASHCRRAYISFLYIKFLRVFLTQVVRRQLKACRAFATYMVEATLRLTAIDYVR